MYAALPERGRCRGGRRRWMNPFFVFVLLILTGMGLYTILARRVARRYWKQFEGYTSFEEFYHEYAGYRAIGTKVPTWRVYYSNVWCGTKKVLEIFRKRKPTSLKKGQFSIWLLEVRLGSIGIMIWFAYGFYYDVARS
jgi:hypothetical protein